MKNIKDLKICRIDFDIDIESQAIAIEMISKYQEQWNCSAKDAIIHLLCDYNGLLNNGMAQFTPSIQKAVKKPYKEDLGYISKSTDKSENNSDNNNSNDEKETGKFTEESNQDENTSDNDDIWAQIISKNNYS